MLYCSPRAPGDGWWNFVETLGLLGRATVFYVPQASPRQGRGYVPRGVRVELKDARLHSRDKLRPRAGSLSTITEGGRAPLKGDGMGWIKRWRDQKALTISRVEVLEDLSLQVEQITRKELERTMRFELLERCCENLDQGAFAATEERNKLDKAYVSHDERLSTLQTRDEDRTREQLRLESDLKGTNGLVAQLWDRVRQLEKRLNALVKWAEDVTPQISTLQRVADNLPTEVECPLHLTMEMDDVPEPARPKTDPYLSDQMPGPVERAQQAGPGLMSAAYVAGLGKQAQEAFQAATNPMDRMADELKTDNNLLHGLCNDLQVMKSMLELIYEKMADDMGWLIPPTTYDVDDDA